MKKIGLFALLFCLCGCGSSQKKEAEGTYTNTKGETTTALVKWDGDKIKEVEIDETTGDTTKKKEGANYNMIVASSIGKEWNEQVAFLENYIKSNGTEKIELNDEGKATNEDIMTGCTISIDGFLKAIDDAKAKAE